MLNRIKVLLGDRGGSEGASETRHSFDELQVAAAALLVEAAEMDEVIGEDERHKIQDLVRARFALSAEEAESLVDIAHSQVADSNQLFGFTRVVKDSFEHDERVELMEMLWEVAYVDGELHHLEASLMRRIAGLIFVSDRDSGSARKRAMRKLGLEA